MSNDFDLVAMAEDIVKVVTKNGRTTYDENITLTTAGGYTSVDDEVGCNFFVGKGEKAELTGHAFALGLAVGMRSGVRPRGKTICMDHAPTDREQAERHHDQYKSLRKLNDSV